MSNSIAYTIPTIGSTADPQWESLLNTALTAIQTHTHDGANAGAKVLPAAVDFTSTGFNFGNQAQTNAAYYEMTQQSSLPSQTAGRGRLACDTSGNLYYVSPSANVLLASSTAINYSSAAKGFVGSNYGSTGGAAFYNTGSASWPWNNAFYLYSATATPSNDTGTRAGLGAAFLEISNTVTTAYTNSVIYRDSSASVTSERFHLGIQAGSSSRGEFGTQVYRATNDASLPAAAFICREIDQSTTTANSVSPAGRSFGFHINGAPTAATANSAYVASIRMTAVNSGTNALSDFSYWLLNYQNGAGTVQAPTDGFGFRHRWALQSPSAPALGTGVTACADVVQWATASTQKGKRQILMATAGTLNTTNPAFEAIVNSIGGVSVAVGTTANNGATSFAIGMNTAVTGTLNTSGALAVSAGGAGITGNTSVTGTFSVIGGNATSLGGTLAVTGTSAFTGAVTCSGTHQATVYTPTSAGTGPVASAGGFYRNIQVLACGTVDTAGNVGSGAYNIASAAWNPGGAGSNVCDVTLTTAVNMRSVQATALSVDIANPGGAVQAQATSTTVIRVTTMKIAPTVSPTAVAYAFSLLGIGDPQ